jgi:exodeoxyribonuclease VII large subunit
MKPESLVRPDRTYTVSELTELVKLMLEAGFPQVWVTGEVSNFHKHASGHMYFSLKDEKCQLRAVMWRSDAARVKFALKDGQQLLCRGRINVYEARGEYQLVVDAVEPKGKGALQLAFEQLKEKLRAEGLFDPARKRKLPLLPKRIGIVTSPKGAALVDILRTLERRFAKLEVLIYPAQVQGAGAAAQIVEGLDYLGALGGLDAIIVGRGGGSIEDLWAFNEEPVARAIARSPVPVISAVGHEVDFTIADFVADIRASTPTAAAEMVVDTEAAFAERIENLGRRAYQSAKFAIEERKSEVVTLAQHRIFQNFKVRLLNLAQDVDGLEERAWEVVRGEQRKIAETKARAGLLGERLAGRFQALLRDKQGDWERLAAALHGQSPLDTLKKGYTLCWSGDGRRAVTGIGGVRVADEMLVSFYRGEFRCRVEAVDREKTIESRAEKIE